MNKFLKKCLFFGSIFLGFALLATAIIFSIMRYQGKKPLIVPDEHKYQSQDYIVDNAEIRNTELNSLPASSTSWIDGAMFGTLNKDDVKEIHFVQSLDDIPSIAGHWQFDNLNCCITEDGVVCVEVHGGGLVMGSSMNSAFANLKNVTKITGLALLRMDNVADMGYMFSNCPKLETIALSGMHTESVVFTNSMFENCESLTSVDLSESNLSSVVGANKMFANCFALEELKLSQMKSLNTIEEGFRGIGQRSVVGTFIDGQLKMPNCVNMNSAFAESHVQNIEVIENMTFGSVKYANNLFLSASLHEIDLSKWNTANLKEANSMFKNVQGMLTCNVSNWDMTNIEDVSEMFVGCCNLYDLQIEWINVSSIADASNMFERCDRIEILDLTSFNNVRIGNASKMFYECLGLKTIKCEKINADASRDMFYMCESLVGAVAYSSNAINASMANQNGYFS